MDSKIITAQLVVLLRGRHSKRDAVTTTIYNPHTMKYKHQSGCCVKNVHFNQQYMKDSLIISEEKNCIDWTGLMSGWRMVML